MLDDMGRSRIARFFALALGVFVALGMSASVIRASDMAVGMASASGMDAADDGKCSHCGDGAADMKATGCNMAACVASALAVLPPSLSLTVDDTRERPSREPTLRIGWASSPDPHPPRSNDLG